MGFTDIFIRRPVLATVVSLLILVLGLRAITSLQVLQYPKTENAVVTITTRSPRPTSSTTCRRPASPASARSSSTSG
jgi:multidrug efflux pump